MLFERTGLCMYTWSDRGVMQRMTVTALLYPYLHLISLLPESSMYLSDTKKMG